MEEHSINIYFKWESILQPIHGHSVSEAVDYADTLFVGIFELCDRISSQKQKNIRETVLAYSWGGKIESFRQKSCRMVFFSYRYDNMKNALT